MSIQQIIERLLRSRLYRVGVEIEHESNRGRRGPSDTPVSIQQIIERLLRSRLYRVGVEIEMDSGEAHRGLVDEVRYDGSRSIVLVARQGQAPARLLLAHIVRVDAPSGPPRHGAAA